ANSTPTPFPLARGATRATLYIPSLPSRGHPPFSSPQIEPVVNKPLPVIETLANRAEQITPPASRAHALGLHFSLADPTHACRTGLARWTTMVAERDTWLGQARTKREKRSSTGTLTRQELRSAQVPPELAQRTLDTVAAISAAQAKVENQRASTLVLQDRIA